MRRGSIWARLWGGFYGECCENSCVAYVSEVVGLGERYGKLGEDGASNDPHNRGGAYHKILPYLKPFTTPYMLTSRAA